MSATLTEKEQQRLAEIEADPDAANDEEVSALADREFESDNGDQQLESLVQRWLAYNEDDLQLRHETGLWLNDRLGSPEDRQTYGAKVIQDLSELIQVDQSNLGRMRWFAHHFPDFDRFRGMYPNKLSWTAVRELLVEEAAKGKPKKKGTKKSRKKMGPTEVLVRSLQRLTDDLQQQKRKAGEDDVDRVEFELNQLCKVVRKNLGVPVELVSSKEPQETVE